MACSATRSFLIFCNSASNSAVSSSSSLESESESCKTFQRLLSVRNQQTLMGVVMCLRWRNAFPPFILFIFFFGFSREGVEFLLEVYGAFVLERGYQCAGRGKQVRFVSVKAECPNHLSCSHARQGGGGGVPVVGGPSSGGWWWGGGRSSTTTRT